MKNLQLLLIVSMLFVSLFSCSDDIDIPVEPIEIGETGDGNLNTHLESLITQYEIPALAGMIIKSGDILEHSSAGLRSSDQNNPVDPNDKWHLGSITKSMTATLVAILIENGVISEEMTVQDVFDTGEVGSEFLDLNLFELLSQSSGITTNEDLGIDFLDGGTIMSKRREWALAALNQPSFERGLFHYTNNNYVIVGAMLEAALGYSWEDLIQTFLFTPLEMNNTGFGAPGSSNINSQPWGHKGSGSNWTPQNPSDIMSENPLAIGPAGTVHSTLNDLAKYIALHQGLTDLISDEALSILHEEWNGTGYALGWNVSQEAIFHAGSNGRWFANLVLSGDNLALFAVTNSYENPSGGTSTEAVFKTLEILGQRYENSL